MEKFDKPVGGQSPGEKLLGEKSLAIVVNGQARTAVEGATVADLLQELGLDGGRIAIERNLNILPRQQWKETLVAGGDRYEIVQFVGGG
ncbi:MAG: hypothetical protein NVS9B4_22120 [Candidatus Acidiferrum sp.]